MKAVVWHGIGDIRLDEVPNPQIQEPTDAVIRITASAICGTDLHFVRGTMAPMVPGTILGHEAVGVVEEVGADVRNMDVGDRVVVCSTIACGVCPFCREGYTAQCDKANPNGPDAGTAFFGGPKDSGPVQGLQAERARIPYAAYTLVKLPEKVSDDQAILLSDIFPTAWFGADIAGVYPGASVLVLGCGPVGQFAIASAQLQGAGRVIAVDRLDDRLAIARRQGAETIDFEREDPIEVIKRLTGGVGVDCVIDCVGVDAQHAHGGPAAQEAQEKEPQFAMERQQTSPDAKPTADGQWTPGDGPGQALGWAVEAVKKAGSIGIIGVYPPTAEFYPIGKAMNKNLTIRMGNCNHRKYVPYLVDLVASGKFDPTKLLTKQEPIAGAIESYEAFDKRQPGWLKVELKPQASMM